MNRIISRTCAMIAEGKSLADVAKYLDPVNQLPSRHHHCVVQEAWKIATRQAGHTRLARLKPQPKAARKDREHRKYRAERRNRQFGRPDVGNSMCMYGRRLSPIIQINLAP